jgi:hypothetical protein
MLTQIRSKDGNDLRESTEKKDAVDGKWTHWGEMIPLSKIGEIRRSIGCRFSSVIVASISRGIKKYCKASSRKCDNMSMYQAVSMWTPEDDITLRNRITGMFILFFAKLTMF